MPTIRDYVRSTFGETYAVITENGGWDGSQKPDVFGIKIEAVVARLFKPSTDPDTLNEYVKLWVGDAVAREMIPFARDYYMVRTRLNENSGRPAGVTPLGGEQSLGYNKIQALITLGEDLRARLTAGYNDFVQLAGSALRPIAQSGAVVASKSTDNMTLDPNVWFELLYYPLVYGYAFGNAYAIKA